FNVVLDLKKRHPIAHRGFKYRAVGDDHSFFEKSVQIVTVQLHQAFFFGRQGAQKISARRYELAKVVFHFKTHTGDVTDHLAVAKH
ncbi:hypothetical protein BVY10_23730, partial [Pseudomonas amygdali pv. morsprunorum]